ncbi:MAG: hypothetical protein J0H69_22555 [Burkholderiales bacterium]|nr:hypothetical protein [Burkholderiales bacterium]
MEHVIPRQYESEPQGERTRRLVEVRGWASDNFVIDEQPAVVINLEADALALLSWGFGQLQQVNVALGELSAAGYSHDPSHKTLGCMLHFSMQAEAVLRVGIERLRARMSNEHLSTQ